MHKRLLQLLRDNAQRQPAGLRMEQSTESATLYLYDVIDPYWGISATEVVKQIAGLHGTPINLRINSPGGDVFDGRAIATAIDQHGNVTAWIDGLAASAATYVATAAKTVNMAEGAFFMIHEAWTLAYGNKRDLTDTAALLDKIDQSIVNDYARKTGQSTDQITAWMQAETWFDATEAHANGFVDAIVQADAPASNTAWNLTAYANTPPALLEPKPAPQPEPDNEQLRATCERRLRLLEPA
ncbi:MAG: head maturation protease, ClpP-related [Chloroflexota bacterium]